MLCSKQIREFVKWKALTSKINLTMICHSLLCQYLEWEPIEKTKQCEENVGGCNEN